MPNKLSHTSDGKWGREIRAAEQRERSKPMDDRVSEIRARQQIRRKAVAAWGNDYIGGPDAVEDVDTLLSLLDAQPQGGPRVVDALLQTVERVIVQHHNSRTHPPTYCCPEDERVYDRLLARMLVEAIPAAPAESTRVAGEHPEDLCHKCGRPNIVWFAPNPLWNKAVREADQPEILCPVCFVQLAEAAGINPVWEVAPQHYHAGAQPSPSLADAIARVREIDYGARFHAADFMGKDRFQNGVVDGVRQCLDALESLTPSDVVLVSREDAANAAEAAWTHCTHLGQPEDSRYKYASEKAAELVRALLAYGDRKDD